MEKLISCLECRLPKPPVDFSVDDHSWSGYSARCKECSGTLPGQELEIEEPDESFEDLWEDLDLDFVVEDEGSDSEPEDSDVEE